jgi:RNA polymerase sigma factor (sigma-70 family)
MTALPAAAVETPVPEGPATDRLATLFDAHHDRLYRLARRLAPTADDAMDLVQEVYLRAGRALGRIPVGAEAEEPWLVQTLVNLRRDQWRREQVRRRFIPEAPVVDPRPDAERTLAARDTVWRALDRLSPRRRAVIVMYELDDMPVAPIATLLGVSRVTVRWHLALGRRELARIITEQGGMPCRD